MSSFLHAKQARTISQMKTHYSDRFIQRVIEAAAERGDVQVALDSTKITDEQLAGLRSHGYSLSEPSKWLRKFDNNLVISWSK